MGLRGLPWPIEEVEAAGEGGIAKPFRLWGLTVIYSILMKVRTVPHIIKQ